MTIAAMGPATAGPGSSKGGAAGSGYNAIPSKVSGNVTSVSFEGGPAKELGDLVALGGKARTLDSMSVLMSSWGCESGDYKAAGNCQTTPGATFDVPLTFTIYDTAGLPLVSQTATVAVPYRPSASAQCTGSDAGRWYNSKDRTCYSGLPHVVTVDMSQSATVLPEQVIWSVQYNTTTSGYTPIGSGAACVTEPGGCGYDALNVGVFSYPNAPFAGTDVNSDAVFFDGAMASGWEGYRPLGAIATR